MSKQIKERDQRESNKFHKHGLCIVCGEYRPVNRQFTCGIGCDWIKLKNPLLFPDPIVEEKQK